MVRRNLFGAAGVSSDMKHLIAIALATVALFSAPVRAETAPNRPLAVFEIADFDAFVASVRTSAAYRLYTDVPRVRRDVDGLIDRVGRTFGTRIDAGRRFLGLTVEEGDEVKGLPWRLHGRLTLTLVPHPITNEIAPLFRVDAKTDAEAERIRAVLSIAEAVFLKTREGSYAEFDETAGVSILRSDADEPILAWLVTGRTALLGQHSEVVTAAVPTLERVPAWRADLDQAAAKAGAASLRAHVDIDAVRAYVGKGGDEGMRNLLALLGALDVRAISAASSFRPDGAIDAVILHGPRGGDGLPRLAELLKTLPTTSRPSDGPAGAIATLRVGSSPADLRRLIDDFAAGLDEAYREKATTGLRELERGLGTIGIDLETDLLAQVKGGFDVHAFPGVEGGGLRFALEARLTDTAAFLRTMESIASAAGLDRHTREGGARWSNVKRTAAIDVVGDRLIVAPPALLDALGKRRGTTSSRATSPALPEGALAVWTVDHRALLALLAAKIPADGRYLFAVDDALAPRLDAETLALFRTTDGAMLIHTSPIAPTSGWLMAAAGIASAQNLGVLAK